MIEAECKSKLRPSSRKSNPGYRAAVGRRLIHSQNITIRAECGE